MRKLKNCSQRREKVKQRESGLKNRIREWARTEPDVFLTKMHGSVYQRGGLPDFVGNVGPIAVYIELKTNTNMSPLQGAVSRKILRSGARFIVVRTFDEFLDFILECRKFEKALEVLAPAR